MFSITFFIYDKLLLSWGQENVNLGNCFQTGDLKEMWNTLGISLIHSGHQQRTQFGYYNV
jgi:hypothetical protein